jgi:hypothetical protein
LNTNRNGKIARLTRAVREELNRWLDNGESGRQLVAWLNAQPEVQAVVATVFGGKAIREQNLSEWKQGGYRDWLARQEALEVAGRLGEDAAELSADGRPPLTDTLALWLAARYAVATRQVAQAEGAEGWRRLRELCADVVELRRGDHSAERLRIDRERLELERPASKKRHEKQFLEWAEEPENKEKICGVMMSREESDRRICEIYGWAPRPPKRTRKRRRRAAAPAVAESSLVKAGQTEFSPSNASEPEENL